jgi:hypothetical protein
VAILCGARVHKKGGEILAPFEKLSGCGDYRFLAAFLAFLAAFFAFFAIGPNPPLQVGLCGK